MISVFFDTVVKGNACICMTTTCLVEIIYAMLIWIFSQYATVCCKIDGNEFFQYPISGSEKYQNEFPTPKYVGLHLTSMSIQGFSKIFLAVDCLLCSWNSFYTWFSWSLFSSEVTITGGCHLRPLPQQPGFKPGLPGRDAQVVTICNSHFWRRKGTMKIRCKMSFTNIASSPRLRNFSKILQ